MIILGALVALCSIGDIGLVNQKSGFVVVEKHEDWVVFNDPILEAEMVASGVVIPPEHQERYGGRERVHFGEEQFFEAFKEFYAVYIFDGETYQWKPLDS